MGIDKSQVDVGTGMVRRYVTEPLYPISPEDCPDFDICEDFLRPFADDVQQWDHDGLRNMDDDGSNAVIWTENALPCANRLLNKVELRDVNIEVPWDLAKVWLDVNVSVAFRKEFENELEKFSAEARTLSAKLQAAKPMSDEWYGACISFDANVVWPFVDYLRSVCVIVKKIAPPTNKPTTTPQLNERKYNILEAMLEKKATDAESRITAEEIAVKAEGPDTPPRKLKVPLSELVKANLICSTKGRAGGYWLSDDGQKLAKHRKSKNDLVQ